MDQDTLNTINRAWGEIAKVTEVQMNAVKILGDVFAFKEDYHNPLFTYKFNDKLKEMRDELIKFVTDEFTKHANYRVEHSKILMALDESLGKSGFDAQILAEYIRDHYEANAEKLSMDEIKREVESLAPHISGYNWHTIKPEKSTFVKKDLLILHCYLNWQWHFEYWALMPRLIAFEKYCLVILKGENPSAVQGRKLVNAYTHTSDDGLGMREVIGSEIIKAIHLYKNSTLKVRFTKEHYADEVADAILRDFYGE